MNRYQSMSGWSTNKRIAEKIYKELQNDNNIEIYAFEPKDIYYCSELKKEFIRSLDYTIRKKLLEKEKWNK